MRRLIGTAVCMMLVAAFHKYLATVVVVIMLAAGGVAAWRAWFGKEQ